MSLSKSQNDLTEYLDQIIKNPQLFDFFQAVRLIHFLFFLRNPKELSAYKNIFSVQDVLRFRSTPSFAFPVSDIAQAQCIDHKNTKHPFLIELHIAVGGMYGAHGLLPFHYTELIMERLQEKDTSLRDFLDQLSQRVFLFFYQAWKKNNFYVGYEESQLKSDSPDDFTQMLNCLTGQDTTLQKHNFPMLDENILFYSGSFSNKRRSAHRLENILSDYFQVHIKTVQFQNRWILLSFKNRTRIGHRIKNNNQLGINALLGKHVLDSQNNFRLCLGPLTYTQFQKFLSNEKKLKIFSYLTKRYIGVGLNFDVQLILKAEEIPRCQLQGKLRLGYDCWLDGKIFCYPVGDTLLKI